MYLCAGTLALSRVSSDMFFSALNCRKLMQHLKISKYSNLDTCKLNARLHTGIAAWTCRRRPQRSFRQRRRVSHLVFLLWMGRDTKLSENFWNSKLSKLSKKRSSAWSKGRKVWRGGQGSQALIFVVKILKQVAATVAAEANQERLLEDRKSGLRKLAVVISGQEWPVITFVTRRKSSEIEVEALVLHAFRRNFPTLWCPPLGIEYDIEHCRVIIPEFAVPRWQSLKQLGTTWFLDLSGSDCRSRFASKEQRREAASRQSKKPRLIAAYRDSDGSGSDWAECANLVAQKLAREWVIALLMKLSTCSTTKSLPKSFGLRFQNDMTIFSCAQFGPVCTTVYIAWLFGLGVNFRG